MATTKKTFDCIVIGSGQAGTPLASALAQSGRKTVLIERSHIGGCCVNEGCTPTKTMIASGRVAYLAGRAGDYGVFQKSSMPAYSALRRLSIQPPPSVASAEHMLPRVDMVKVRQRKRDIVDSFKSGNVARLGKIDGLEVLMGEARFIGPNTISIGLGDGDQVDVEAETVFINVGERPGMPDLEGLASVIDGEYKSRILDSTSIQELDAIPGKLIVLGGGYVGLEFGQLFGRLGSQVTVVQRAKQLLPREDSEVADVVQKILEEENIEVLLDAQATGIKANDRYRYPLSLAVNINGTETVVQGSHILLATGRVPNTDMLRLDNVGVDTDSRGHIKVSPTLQTSVPHIYALGDCHGGPAFTHMSYDDFRVIKANLVDKPEVQLTTINRMNPYVVYIDPQLGHIGLHEAEARKQHPTMSIKTATMPMSYVARALETDEIRGLMKAIVDGDSGQILGFTCLGIEGGEIMSIVQVAMMGKVPYTTLQQAVFAHPTLAESLNNLWGFLK